MPVDPAILSPASARLGALIRDGASLCAANLTQRGDDRFQALQPRSQSGKRSTTSHRVAMSSI